MRTQTIDFPGQQATCVFLEEGLNLTQAIAELDLKGRYPVIVLIGGELDGQQTDMTRRAIEMIARTAEDMKAVIICGGTDMGVMAEMGRARSRKKYKFPLVGIAPEELVTWPSGPHTSRFLWWGNKRWQLESHHSHFILVPGSQFGDESASIISAATLLSNGRQLVTILINGAEVSRKDIQLSLDNHHRVIILSRTGGLADELARQPARNNLITVFPVNAEKSIAEAVQAALSTKERTDENVDFQAVDQRTG
jgi:hypothetical protein